MLKRLNSTCCGIWTPMSIGWFIYTSIAFPNRINYRGKYDNRIRYWRGSTYVSRCVYHHICDKISVKTRSLTIRLYYYGDYYNLRLEPIYAQYNRGANKYSFDEVDTLFLARDIYIMQTIEDGTPVIAPIYLLICKFKSQNGNKVV
ncbi:MAG: hypothetical protein ACFFBQ_05375 [Promethearchaeota archaeon]